MYEGILDEIKDIRESVESVNPILKESKESSCPKSSDLASCLNILSASSDFVDIYNESEVKVIKEVKKDDKILATVNVTGTPDDTNEVEIRNLQRSNTNWSKFIIQDSSDSNEDSNAGDSVNQNDCSNDSDVDNYYTTSDCEEVDAIKKEVDKSKAESPPLILSILKDLCENRKLYEQPARSEFDENAEAENLEILEENNNDPNNNNDLEEVQLVEQLRPISPVAGCSRSFHERDFKKSDSPKILNVNSEDSVNTQMELTCFSTKVCQHNTEPQPSCSKEFTEIEEHDEVEELAFKKSSRINYEKLLEETQTINRLFPDVSGDMIFSMLAKYKRATNRVTIVLWDLLPRERPEPNILKKRKRESDPYFSNRKRASPSLSLSKIDSNTMRKIQNDLKNVEKYNSSEVDTSFSSTDELTTDQSFSDVDIFDVKNHHKESPKRKDKNLLRPSIIQPVKFHFPTIPVSKTESKPPQKHLILAPPKLIINSRKELSSTNFQQATPRRTPTTPMKEFSDEEGFITEKTKFVNTDLNISEDEKLISEPKLKKDELEKSNPIKNDTLLPDTDMQLKKVQYEIKQTARDGLQMKVKDSESFEEVRKDMISKENSNRISTDFQQSPDYRFQKLDTVLGITSNGNNENELENSLKRNLSNEQLEPRTEIDFQKSNRLNQICSQTQINNNCKPLSKLSNPVKFTEPLQLVVVAGPSTVNSVVKKNSQDSEIPCKDIYYKLRSIFPDVDPEFIKEKCISPSFDMRGLSKEQQLNMLVEILLTDGSKHYQTCEIKDESIDIVNKDEQYENLLGIFPEADPTYLRDFVDKNYTNSDSLKNFVQINLENPSYPTRDEYLKKVKITQQIKEYTTDFNIRKFLHIFPDPVRHFENPNRKSEYSAVVYEFLKNVFCKHKVVTIALAYRKRNHHLSLTASDLRRIFADMKNKRNSLFIPTENIPLLQEMAFVRHKSEIVSYLEEIKIKEKKEFHDLKAKGMLLECQCCFSDECLPRKCFTCEKGHLFCDSCILRGTESKMGDGQNHISCFANCDSEIGLSVLQQVLPPTTFSILLQKRQEAEVMAAGLKGLVSCPFCHFASIPPSESKVFKCLNPECMKETCRLCKELNHVPLKCDEVIKANQARRHLEEKMTEALVRICYMCLKSFFKEEGCNKMTCVCGASMCYLCSTPLKNGDYSHFNGQGATSVKLCPLWSDNRRLNAEVVRRVAEVTENEIRKKNPNLKIDAKGILPTLPPKTRGPHDDIPNANALPEYIRRVANINP